MEAGEVDRGIVSIQAVAPETFGFVQGLIRAVEEDVDVGVRLAEGGDADRCFKVDRQSLRHRNFCGADGFAQAFGDFEGVNAVGLETVRQTLRRRFGRPGRFPARWRGRSWPVL